MPMPKEYLELAKKRSETNREGYTQPEDYGYDFRDWVSPYTKGANKTEGIFIVLQDWTGSDTMDEIPDAEAQEYGRTLELKTNIKLESLLQIVFGLGIKDVYATNVFPFIKAGSISSRILIKDIRKAANIYLKKEIEIAKPTLIIALGNMAASGLQSIGIEHVHLPHPAARIGSIDKHEKIWREKFNLNT